MKRPLSAVRDVMLGKTSAVKKKLEQGADLNERARNWTLPHWACQEGHLKIVRLLIKFGADVNVSEKEDFTPLVMAAGKGHNAIVRELLKAGAEAASN